MSPAIGPRPDCFIAGLLAKTPICGVIATPESKESPKIFIKLTKSKHRDMFIAHVTPTHGSKLIHRSNTIFTIVAVLSSEKQRKTAAEQRTFCCFLGRRIARKLGFLPNTTPRSL